MKRKLFWVTFVPLGILLLIVGLIGSVGHLIVKACEGFYELLSAWEGWCFEYKKHGWTRVGGGIWTKRHTALDSLKDSLR